MASMLISGMIPLLQQSGLMLEMEEQYQKLLEFFTDALPKLADAELRAEAEPDVRTWLNDFNTVAYEADDIVDDFRYAKLQAEAEADSCQTQNGDRVRVGLFLLSCFKTSSINRSGALQGIENRIGSIVNRIDDLDERMRALNFRPGQEINITSLEMPQRLNFSSPTEIVGREKEIREIKNLIPFGFSVYISFVGPQGIGKTALARFICNNIMITYRDRYKRWLNVVWVDVGSEFNIGKITKSIIDQVIGKDCCISEGDTDLLELRLSQELCHARCLVVLDDVRTVRKELILEFNKLMKTKVRTNWLIVTSSFQEVVQMFEVKHTMNNANYNYVLEPLMDHHAWNLFCKKAFSDDANETCPEILEKMGKKIVDTCGGSPLALNMMGALMRFKKQPEEWQRVINQLEYYTVDGVATVEKIIKVCYDNLCSQVKQCFAFCSLFPEGYYMDKEVLIKLWMANGLLLPSDGSRTTPPEENGDIVFNKLASRHFFEDVKLVHEDSYGNEYGYHSRVKCKMLDLIHEQAVIAAREFALQNPYLLSISDDSQVDIPILLEPNPDTRTLLFPGDPFIRNVNCSAVPRANSLRGLHLQSALFQRDLLVLKYMRHLRYLDLSRSRIKILPESTSLLYFLQTLNLSKCLFLYQLPKNMKYMKSLRHLYIHKCPRLKKMPAHFRKLSNLQTLTTYIVGEENTNTGIDQIKGLHLGGLLELYNLRKVKNVKIAKGADLVSKTNLDRLTLNWGTEPLVMSKGNNDLGVLEALQPHTQLKVLKVQQYGGREFAAWLANPVAMGFVNFVELHLIGCSQCETLPAVWKLPSLNVLCLKHMPSLTCISRTDEKDSSGQFFPSLKRLVLVGLMKLERWHEKEEEGGEIEEEEGETEEEEEEETEEEEEGGEGSSCSYMETSFELTMLDQLEITSCPNLKIMPRVPRLKHITASIENYRLLWSITNVITREESLVKEANIAKASSTDNEPFPALEEKVEKNPSINNLRILRMDSTNSFFMPTILPHSLLGFSGLWISFNQLEYLEIINCNTLVSWPLEFRYLRRLVRLSIRMCPNLTGELPAQAKNNSSLKALFFISLRKLEFYGCSSLKQVPKCGNKLSVLELDECAQVESISGIEQLDMLYLSCISWTSLPSWLPEIKELGTLWVSDCPRVKELPGGEWLSSLKKLKISECPDLDKFCKEGPYSSIISKIGQSTDNSPSAI
ncbi:putative disease resistance protein RGA3 [Carex rostrata]